MNRLLTILIFFYSFCGPTFADDLKTMSLDDASTLGTTIQTDLAVKTEGKGSIRITTLHPTTICIGEINDLDVENVKLVYQAKVKNDLEGFAFLEMWAHIGAGQYLSVSQKAAKADGSAS